ncbi:MAG: guanylate kinase [Anaerolineae bacterium]|nr:guanylate kinase [Anaerolineae bacterium]
MPREGRLFILVGPSGAGKNTLMKRVQQHFDDLPQLATMTTRAIRKGEQNGREHWFVTHDEFRQLIADDALIEYQQVHMNDLYGTPRSTVETAIRDHHDLIADIEFLGAGKIYTAYPDHSVLIFVTPSRLDILVERIKQRGDISPDVLNNRFRRAQFEMTFAPQCHYVVINDDLDTAADHLRQIIAHERDQYAEQPAARHTIHGTVTALIEHQENVLIQANTPDRVPTFAIADQNQATPPHEALQQHLARVLPHPVTIGAFSDSRFDFVAPDYVTIDSPPPDVGLTFYYRCVLPEPAALTTQPPPGWIWQPVAALNLPAAVRQLISP